MGYWKWLLNVLRIEEAKAILLSIGLVILFSVILKSLTLIASDMFGMNVAMIIFIIGLVFGTTFIAYIVTEKVI